MRLQAGLLLLASWAVPLAWAIFADEVDHLDFHHSLLGIPLTRSTLFHKPSSSSNASLLYTITEGRVLGAVNPKDGSMVWRQRLVRWPSPNGAAESFLRASEGQDTIMSAVGGDVFAWGALDGRLSWKGSFSDGPIKGLELLEFPNNGPSSDMKDSIALFGDETGIVRRLDGLSGRLKWEFHDDSGDLPFQISSSPTEIFYISLQSASLNGYKIKVTALNLQTGRQTKQHILASENDILTPESILFVGTNSVAPLIVWADKLQKTLKVNIMGSKQVNSVSLENNSGETIRKLEVQAPTCPDCPLHFLVHSETDSSSWAEVYHVDLRLPTVSKVYQLPRLTEKSVFATSNRFANVYFTRIAESEISVVSSVSHEILGKWPHKRLTDTRPLHAVSEVVSKGDSVAVRFAYVLDSGDWVLIRNGVAEWTRHEALAHIVAAAWAEVDDSEGLVRELQVEVHEGLLKAYVHRVKRHARDLQHLPGWLRALPKRIFTSFVTGSVSKLDSFGLAKRVLVCTENGRVAAIDTGKQGAIAWNIKVSRSGKWGVKAITSQHGSAVIYTEDGGTVNLNVTTGEIISLAEPVTKIKSIAVLPNEPSPITISIGEDGAPLESVRNMGYIVTLSDDGRVLGWRAGDNKSPVWEFLPNHGERILHATSRPPHDPVASIGKVLGNRSVLYKYLNPNLALVTAVGEATATFYLLDAVSGKVLYSSMQTGVDTTQPIATVISENWFAYSLWADVTDTSDTKGYQLVISDLYESSIPNDRGPLGSASNYSSIHTTDFLTRPHAISQSFIISEPISQMAVTQTRQGITIRQLLCTLPMTNAIIGIPRPALDPRRPVDRDPTSSEAEEGLSRYTPFLEFDGRWYLTHARDVADIRAIISSPTLLESTSLVFAFGGDIFGTRVMPSQAFDILGRGFSKAQLVVTVLALMVGVVILAPMVRKKQVNLLWDQSSWA